MKIKITVLSNTGHNTKGAKYAHLDIGKPYQEGSRSCRASIHGTLFAALHISKKNKVPVGRPFMVPFLQTLFVEL
jgi:hypothetical protein